MKIPVVDFAECAIGSQGVTADNLKSLGETVYTALATVGFVYLKNTGISMEQIGSVNQTMKRFYGLKEDIKKQYAVNENYVGYVGFKMESTNTERPGDLKEAFNFSGNGSAINEHAGIDEHVPEFNTTLSEFHGTCRLMAARILQVLSFGMKLKDKEYLTRCHSRMGDKYNFTTLRSLYYPPIPDDQEIEQNRIRLGEHSDYGSFTLLFKDENGGLEIEDFDGNYIEAKPIPGTVIVNIGDLLQFWTKGRLKSTRHRIRIPEDPAKRRTARQSLVYFFHPNYEVPLTEIEYETSSIPNDHVHAYCDEYNQIHTAQEYCAMKLRNSYH